MYNECNQHESCTAGWNSNSCSVQPRQPSHGFCDVTGKGRSKVSKVRTHRRSRHVNEPSRGQEPTKEHNVFVPSNEKARAPVSATVLLPESNEYLNSLEKKINTPQVFPRKNVKRPTDELVFEQKDDHANHGNQKPPPDPSSKTNSEARRHGIFPSVRTTGLEDMSNSNSFRFFITTDDEGKTENQSTISSRVHSRLARPTSYVHVKNVTNKPCDTYSTEYIPQRRSVSVIEKKSPPMRTRYVTELKLNLHKGRAQRVSRNWPPGLVDQDSQSDDHGEHTEPEDVQVKAILCRASSSINNQDEITTGCVSQIGRDVIQFIAPKVKPKGNKREKVDSHLELQNGANSVEFVQDYQKTVNDCEVEHETGHESKLSVNTPGQTRPRTCSTESKRISDTQTSFQDEQRLGASSTQTAAQTNVSPGSFSISSLRQGLPMSHSETQASPTALKKETEWPNCSGKNTELNKFMQEMALNNIQSVLSEANRDLCFDEPSVTSACTLIRSSVGDEPSVRTLAECVSTATVISPMAGKTSRGTQSEQLEQVKVVRDMEIQTGLEEIPEELPQDISLDESEVEKPFKANRINSPFPANRGVPIVSRLPLPTNRLIRAEWTQEANRNSNDGTPENRQAVERDRFVSPSPSSYLVLPPVQNFAESSDSPSLAPSASDSGQCWPSPINPTTTTTAASLIPIPGQITPPRKSLYRLVRENVSSVSNNTQKPILHTPKLPHLTTSIPELEIRSPVNQLERNLNKDLCQDKIGNRACYGPIYQEEPQTNQMRPERESCKSTNNMQPSSTQRMELLNISQTNKDVVFVERSSSQNSSQDSTRIGPCINQFYLGHGKQTSDRFSMNPIQVTTGKPYMNTAGDQTTETCGCCPDGTCDCPTSTTVTGSQACACGCCHVSGTAVSEDMMKKVHMNSPQTLRQTAGDEGSFRGLPNHDPRMGHVCDIVSGPSHEAGTITMKKSNMGQNSSQCSCCSESTLTEVMPHKKMIQEQGIKESFGTVVGTSNEAPTQSGNRPEPTEFRVHATPWVSKLPPVSYNQNSTLLERNEIQRPGPVLVPPRGENSLMNKQTESTPVVNEGQMKNTQIEIMNRNQTSCIPRTVNQLQPQPTLSDFKAIPKRSTEFVQDAQDEKYVSDDTKKIKSTSPYIDTLFNLVGQKEKRSILQRWLLEQVAFSTKRNQLSGSESKTQENSDVHGAEVQREEEQEEEEDSSSSGNGTDSGSSCSCSVCRETAEARVPEEIPESSEGSHTDYSHYSDSLASGLQPNGKPTTLARGRSQIPVRCAQKDYDHNYMRFKLNNRCQTGRGSMEPQNGRNGEPFCERPTRSNSEGSLEQFDARPDYLTYQKQMIRSSGWRPTEPHRLVSPSVPAPRSVPTTQLSRNAQDQVMDNNVWNINQQRRFFSPARTDKRETASRTHETSTGSRLGGQTMHNVTQARNYRLMPRGRTIPVARDTPDGRRMTNQISSGKPKSLIPHDPRIEGRNQKVKQNITRSRFGTQMRNTDPSATQSKFGSFTPSRTTSGTGQNEFEVHRVFELNQYDDLVKSHLNVADRRIKAVALKNGCQIRITGPITRPDISVGGVANRGKTLYNCHISGPSDDRIGKCVNFLKETFPNSFLRTNWRL